MKNPCEVSLVEKLATLHGAHKAKFRRELKFCSVFGVSGPPLIPAHPDALKDAAHTGEKLLSYFKFNYFIPGRET